MTASADPVDDTDTASAATAIAHSFNPESMSLFMKKGGFVNIIHVNITQDVKKKIDDRALVLQFGEHLNEMLGGDSNARFVIADVVNGRRIKSNDAAEINTFADRGFVGTDLPVLAACDRGDLVVELIGESHIVFREVTEDEIKEKPPPTHCSCPVCVVEELDAE